MIFISKIRILQETADGNILALLPLSFSQAFILSNQLIILLSVVFPDRLELYAFKKNRFLLKHS